MIINIMINKGMVRLLRYPKRRAQTTVYLSQVTNQNYSEFHQSSLLLLINLEMSFDFEILNSPIIFFGFDCNVVSNLCNSSEGGVAVVARY